MKLTELPKIEKKLSTFNLNISKELEAKIRLTCSNVSNVEWSGILFYTTTGSFEDNNLIVECKDILIMSIDTASTTEFKVTAEIPEYMLENDLLDCYTGLIHSHHHMKTFFSTTDLSTLATEALDSNHFVSLIVNNEGTYSAAITRVVKIKEQPIEASYGTFNDNTVSIPLTLNERLVPEYYILNINIESRDNVSIDRINRLKAEKEIRKDKTPVSSFPNYRLDTTSTYTDIVPPSVQDTPIFPSLSSTEFDDIPFNKPTTGLENYDTLFVQGIEDVEIMELYSCTDYVVKNALLQIVTGNILSNIDNKLNLPQWCNTMFIRYKQRFKDEEAAKYWIDVIVDYVLWYTIDPKLSNQFDQEVIVDLLGHSLLIELDKLPSNLYMSLIKKSIENGISENFKLKQTK